MPAIEPAKIHYNDQGTPVSDTFDDVYFSNDSGLEETRYVFLQQNGLPERWMHHPKHAFHIIETGFGTGLNFLLSWFHFRQTLAQSPTQRCQRLYFTSFEKYPIAKIDLEKALLQWPELAEFAAELLAQYPVALPGCHRLQFEQGQVFLDLWLGDIHDTLPQVPAGNLADAWYLDGFAPSKNPQMWQPQLFAQMARLSHAQTTVATFTSAGLVRRGLAEVGFQVKKIKGYGRKREMCIAHFQTTDCNLASNNAVPASTNLVGSARVADEVCIVGGGLAAITLALQCVQRGLKVHLVCKDEQLAMGASHNRQGALYPQLHAQFSPISSVHAIAFGYAQRFYQHCLTNFEFAADFCGVLTLACTEQLRIRQEKMRFEPAYPAELMHHVDATQASLLAGIDQPFSGVFFPQGGWIAPQQFCRAAAQWLQQHANFRLTTACEVFSISACAQGSWQLKTSQGDFASSALVLATGDGLKDLLPEATLPLNLIRGQVSHVETTALKTLKTVICHQGYITPAYENLHCVGATFDRNSHQAIELPEDNSKNLALVNTVFQSPPWFEDAKVTSAKTGVRVTLPDHLPVAGQLLDGLWIFGALGARGLLFAPLLAEQLACQLSDEPLSLSTAMMTMLSPQRFSA